MSAAPSVLTATPAMSSSGAPGPDASAARRKWRIGRVELGLFALLYAGLCGLVLVAYVVARVRDPALFAWGQHLLSPQRGLWLLAVLPAGGVALLAARHFAGRGQFRRAAAALGITVLAGGAFLVVCGIDYDSKVVRRLVPGKRFKPNERYVAWRFGVRLPRDWRTARAAPVAVVADAAAAPPAKREVSAAHGRELFLRVCASCHGVRGEGLIGSGKELRANEFVAAREDGKLVEFLKTGRQPWDPDNTTKVQMPARGGDPRVTDDDLRDVVAYLREMQKRGAAPTAGAAAPASAAAGQAPAGATAAAPAPAASQTPEEPPDFIVHRSYLPEASPGPAGLSPAYRAARAQPAWAMPHNAQSYFSMYFALSGLGALHVAGALIVVLTLLVGAVRRRSSTLPVSAATATWWWATACWGLAWCLLYR